MNVINNFKNKIIICISIAFMTSCDNSKNIENPGFINVACLRQTNLAAIYHVSNNIIVSENNKDLFNLIDIIREDLVKFRFDLINFAGLSNAFILLPANGNDIEIAKKFLEDKRHLNKITSSFNDIMHYYNKNKLNKLSNDSFINLKHSYFLSSSNSSQDIKFALNKMTVNELYMFSCDLEEFVLLLKIQESIIGSNISKEPTDASLP
jgi:hypothetical protein